MVTFLFPAIHRLGFQAGQAVSRFFYIGAAKIDTESLTDMNLLLDSAWAFILWLVKAPSLYKTWWWNLFSKDPLHVAIETILLICLAYMALSRSTEGYKDSSKDKLNKREQEELLLEWKNKTRAPLVPPQKTRKGETKTETVHRKDHISVGVDTNADGNDDDDFQIVVQKQEGKWLTITVPNHWVSNHNNNNNNSGNMVSNLINRNSAKKNGTNATALSSLQQRHETELRVLNFGNFDFLGLQTSDELRKASTDALNHYGCGSCGPRGFYGTIDAHLEIEEQMSRFCGTDQAVLYSDGATTCSSTVAAFAKRGDVLVVDEGVYEPITTGIYLSRANVHWFRHNDVEDLERVLKELQATDRKLGRKPGAQRRFIVVEGLYKNMGTIAPLDKIVALKHKYKYRLILDESFSFGTLGKTGRGALEEHNKRPMYDSEITTIGLENAMGSIGGVSVGNEEVADHQRLSGAGYCYSASAPPFTSAASLASLKILEKKPELVERLQSNVKYMYKRLLEKVEEHNKTSDESNPCHKLVVTSDSRSPIVVLQLEGESVYESAIMRTIMRHCLQGGIGVVASTTPPKGDQSEGSNGGTLASSLSPTELAPCIRMTVTALHTREDMNKAIDVLIESAALVTSSYHPVAAPTESMMMQ